MSEYFLFGDRKFVLDTSDPTNASLLPLEAFVQWQDNILAARSNVYRVRRWGDPIMVTEGGLSVNLIGTSNFQAVGLFNKSNNTMGGVSNYVRVPSEDVDRLKALQMEDEYQDKVADWRQQKMNYLCKPKGTVYFWVHSKELGNDWNTRSYIEWGTIALGGNLVTVEGIESLKVKTPDEKVLVREMARIKCFVRTDWNRPLTDLLADGVVHRCFGAYFPNDKFLDSPKGIIYTPVWSPRDWIFIGKGQAQPTNYYIPKNWLSK